MQVDSLPIDWSTLKIATNAAPFGYPASRHQGIEIARQIDTIVDEHARDCERQVVMGGDGPPRVPDYTHSLIHPTCDRRRSNKGERGAGAKHVPDFAAYFDSGTRTAQVSADIHIATGLLIAGAVSAVAAIVRDGGHRVRPIGVLLPLLTGPGVTILTLPLLEYYG